MGLFNFTRTDKIIAVTLFIIMFNIAFVLPTILGMSETLGKPPSKQDLQNDSNVKSFCSSKGYNDGTSAYLDTYKNMDSGRLTWFEWQAVGTPFGHNSIYCFGNSTGSFYQRQYRVYIEKESKP